MNYNLVMKILVLLAIVQSNCITVLCSDSNTECSANSQCKASNEYGMTLEVGSNVRVFNVALKQMETVSNGVERNIFGELFQKGNSDAEFSTIGKFSLVGTSTPKNDLEYTPGYFVDNGITKFKFFIPNPNKRDEIYASNGAVTNFVTKVKRHCCIVGGNCCVMSNTDDSAKKEDEALSMSMFPPLYDKFLKSHSEYGTVNHVELSLRDMTYHLTFTYKWNSDEFTEILKSHLRNSLADIDCSPAPKAVIFLYESAKRNGNYDNTYENIRPILAQRERNITLSDLQENEAVTLHFGFELNQNTQKQLIYLGQRSEEQDDYYAGWRINDGLSVALTFCNCRRTETNAQEQVCSEYAHSTVTFHE